jgi:hypothetical protein
MYENVVQVCRHALVAVVVQVCRHALLAADILVKLTCVLEKVVEQVLNLLALLVQCTKTDAKWSPRMPRIQRAKRLKRTKLWCRYRKALCWLLKKATEGLGLAASTPSETVLSYSVYLVYLLY